MNRPIDMIIIHCAATPDGRPNTAADIRKWHTDPPPLGRGWRDIGYHFVIRIDGAVEPGRPVEQPGAHALGYNAHSIGICMVGSRRFTQPQWDALRRMIAGMVGADYPNAKVIGHREVEPHKECPGFDVQQWLRDSMTPQPQHILDG